MLEIIGVIVLVILAGFFGVKIKGRFSSPSTKYSEPMDYQTKYETLKKVSEKKEQEAINELKNKDFPTLRVTLTEQLDKLLNRKRGSSKPDNPNTPNGE